MEDGSYKFSLQLWWEIPHCVGKLNRARVPMKCIKVEVRDEFHDVSCATKRVASGGMPYKDAITYFKSVSTFGECSLRRPAERPLIFTDRSSGQNPIIKASGLYGMVMVDGLTDPVLPLAGLLR